MSLGWMRQCKNFGEFEWQMMREINGNLFHPATVKTEYTDHEEQVGRKKINEKENLLISRVQKEDKCIAEMRRQI